MGSGRNDCGRRPAGRGHARRGTFCEPTFFSGPASGSTALFRWMEAFASLDVSAGASCSSPVPLPAIIYYQITFPLQLLASRFAGSMLDLLQVPALREGNLIILPNDTLAVAEACSGISRCFPCWRMAVAYGYIFEKNVRRRIALAAVMIPIAIISNGVRIVGTALIAYFIGPAWAEGFFPFHRRVVDLFDRAGFDAPRTSRYRLGGALAGGKDLMSVALHLGTRTFIAAAILVAGIALLHSVSLQNRVPLHAPLRDFPEALARWQGTEQPLSDEILKAVAVDEYLNRVYSDGTTQPIELYIGYYESQRTGDTIHSPKNRLPGSGWNPVEADRLSFAAPDGKKLAVNGYR